MVMGVRDYWLPGKRACADFSVSCAYVNLGYGGHGAILFDVDSRNGSASRCQAVQTTVIRNEG